MQGKNLGQGLLFLISAFAMTACSNSARQTATGEGSGNLYYSDEIRKNGTVNDPFQSGNTTDPTPTPAPTVVEPTTPLVKQVVRGVGYFQEVTLTVQTRNILKVKFVPETQDRSVTGTNYYPNYSKLAAFISVGSSEQATTLLNNGADGYNSQEESAIMDFSSAIDEECAEDEPDCIKTVTITISRPNYDYYLFSEHQRCWNNANGYPVLCTDWTKVYETHPWRATVYVQTDFTKYMRVGVRE